MTYHEILQRVLTAMQPAEESGGPEGRDYEVLMLAIAHEANTRLQTYRQIRTGAL